MLMKNKNIISALIGLMGAVSNGGKAEKIREEKYIR